MGKILFKDLENLEILNRYSRVFSRIFGINFSLVDAETYKYVSVFPLNRQNPFCLLIQTSPEGMQRCLSCDREHFRKALNTDKPCIYKCHAGLTDFIVPVSIEGRVMAFLVSGQILNAPPTGASWQGVLGKVRDLPSDIQKLRRHYFQTPVVSRARLDDIIELLTLFTRYFSDAGSHLVLLEHAYKNDLVYKARDYIMRNFANPLTLPDIARAVHKSAGHLSRVFKQETGYHLVEYIRKCRLEYACRLLLSTDPTILQAALDSGFGSLPQFNRSFRQEFGISPGCWRKNKRKGKCHNLSKT